MMGKVNVFPSPELSLKQRVCQYFKEHSEVFVIHYCCGTSKTLISYQSAVPYTHICLIFVQPSVY